MNIAANNLILEEDLIPLEDYDKLILDFNQRMVSTKENRDRALMAYIYEMDIEREGKRRKMLCNYLNNVITWREMCNFTHVVLGDGDMIDFIPLAEHPIITNWDTPYNVWFDDCEKEKELEDLMDYAAMAIHAARLRIWLDVVAGKYDNES